MDKSKNSKPMTNEAADEEMTVELELDDGEIVNCAVITILTVKEKDYMSMVGLINTLTNVKSVVVAPVKGARALSMDNIIPLLKNVDITDKSSVVEGFEYAMKHKKDNEKLFCVGSLYMVGEIMEYIEKG